MVVTYLLDCAALPDPLEHEGMLSGLPKERVWKIRRLKPPGARKQSFGAGLLLDHVLRQEAGHFGAGLLDDSFRQEAGHCEEKRMDGSGAGNPCRTEIQYNACGKPFSGNVPFNLSHTGNYVILSIWHSEGAQPIDGFRQAKASGRAAPDGLHIGCDMEQVKGYEPRTARRFFTGEEYLSLESVAGKKSQAELFCRYWTRKESVLKLVGLGLALPMDLFDVCRGDRAIVDREKTMDWYGAAREKEKPEYKTALGLLLGKQLYFQEYWHEGCCITVCSTVGQFAAHVQQVTLGLGQGV